jgi:hypothetical protein
VLHHGFLFLYSLVCCTATFAYLASSGELTDAPAFYCRPPPPWLRALSLSFTASKLLEWVDTMVMFMRGYSPAKIGILHSYHHATTFWLFLLVGNFPSTEKCGMLLNGFVHTLMYYHYAWRLPKWARPLITGAQIVQLAYVVYVWSATPAFCPMFRDFPEKYAVEFSLPYCMVPVFLVLFLKFFVSTYCCKGGGVEDATAGGRGRGEKRPPRDADCLGGNAQFEDNKKER